MRGVCWEVVLCLVLLDGMALEERTAINRLSVVLSLR